MERWLGFLANQIFAADLESVEISQHRQADVLLIEESLRDALDIVGGNNLDAVDQLVQGKEVLEIHFLPCQIRHTAGSGFEAEHERALEMILRPAQFLIGNPILLELLEFLEDGLD